MEEELNAPQATNEITLTPVGTFSTGIFDESAAEIVTYNATTQRLFVVNANNGTVDILDVSDPSNPVLNSSIEIGDLGAGANSVAASPTADVIAVAIEAEDTQAPGSVGFFDVDGNLINTVTAGALPDLVTFTPDGSQVLVANEGEPNEEFTVDPEGSVSIIDVSGGFEGLSQENVTTASFAPFNDQREALIASGVRIFGPGATVAQDLEPEFIAPTNELAFVSLQENNALAVVDIEQASETFGSVLDILPLGFKDFSQEGLADDLDVEFNIIFPENNLIDASDEDGLNLQNVPLLSPLQPDAIAVFTGLDGETYIVTANEGDARDYEAFSEEADIGELQEEGLLDLNDDGVPDAADDSPFAELSAEDSLGEIVLTNQSGDLDGDGLIEQLVGFGGRSFSVFDPQGNLVFDSGDDFERITADVLPQDFNSNNDENGSFDDRSDDKGPEPEAIDIGVLNGVPYAFIGFERVGGIAVYSLLDPSAPEFVEYVNNRNFRDEQGNPIDVTIADGETNPAVGDLGPEGIEFISAEDSPTGEPLLAVGNEVSGTTTLFAIEASVPELTIPEIQGAAQTSPFVGVSATTTGIVTAVDSNGFYLQDPEGDGDSATSDGIFVFTDNDPPASVGDLARVTGTVSEFIPGGADTGNLSITQISGSLSIELLSSDNELPAPVILGASGRVPPTGTIDNDLEIPYSVLAGEGEFQPEEDGIDFYETVEGMRVTIEDPLAISGTNRFGEIYTVANNGENATNLSLRGTINNGPEDFNPERIQVQFDDDILPDAEVTVDTGARLGDVTGVVGYSFGNFEVNVTEPVEVVEESTLEPDTSNISATEDELTVAAYNVLNLDPNEDDGDTDIANDRFSAIAEQIANNLGSPDIVALQEIQDNDGAADPDTSDVTAADVTLQLLVDEIEAAGGPSYEFIDNPFIGNNTNGGQPGGNIRNAYLYNPERVDLVEGSLSPVTDPQDQQTNEENPFFNSRLPLAATFTFNGEDVTLVNNHFSSKGGSNPLFGDLQPAESLQNALDENGEPLVNGSLDERLAQAQAVNDFVDDILGENANANVVVLGDLNEFEFVSPIDPVLVGGEDPILTNLTDTLPPDERYSFIFQGNSQTLDHILVTNNLADSAEFDQVHVNSEFAETPQRASDHDPLVASLDLDADEPATLVFGDPEPNLLEATLSPGFDGSDNYVFSGGSDDTIDPSTGGAGVGDNRFYGGSGADELIASTGDRALGGSGNDTLDASLGGGNNRLYGGDGADDLFVGTGDRALGGEGSDRLFATEGGDNVFSGGEGADQFWIANGQVPASSANTVTDFSAGEDAIGIAGLGLEFADLSITSQGENTLISALGSDLALLLDITPENLSEADFVFNA